MATPSGRCYGTRTTVRQIPEVRARAAARGPARSIQPGHIDFSTGNWVLLVCFDGIINRQIAHGRIRRYIPRLEELTDLHLATSPLTTHGF